jgi:hypothetical protein
MSPKVERARRSPMRTLPVSPAAVEAWRDTELVPVGGDDRAAQPLVAWGGPHIKLGDLQSPGASPFILDDPMDEVDWRNF